MKWTKATKSKPTFNQLYLLTDGKSDPYLGYLKAITGSGPVFADQVSGNDVYPVYVAIVSQPEVSVPITDPETLSNTVV